MIMTTTVATAVLKITIITRYWLIFQYIVINAMGRKILYSKGRAIMYGCYCSPVWHCCGIFLKSLCLRRHWHRYAERRSFSSYVVWRKQVRVCCKVVLYSELSVIMTTRTMHMRWRKVISRNSLVLQCKNVPLKLGNEWIIESLHLYWM